MNSIEETKKFKKLKKEKINKEHVYLAVLAIFLYLFSQVAPIFFAPFLKTKNSLYLIAVIFEIILIPFLYLCFKKRIDHDFKYLKDNFKQYFKFIISKQVIAFSIYFVISLLSLLILNTDEASLNQQAIEQMPIIIIAISAVLCAPIIEELIFRGCIRRFIKNDYIFIIISGLIFGFLHTAMEGTSYEMIIRGLPYITLGIYFSYMYVRTENICTSMVCHFLHNSLALIAIIIGKIF